MTKQTARIKVLETKLTRQAMEALLNGDMPEYKRLIAERDCQTSWLRTYA